MKKAKIYWSRGLLVPPHPQLPPLVPATQHAFAHSVHVVQPVPPCTQPGQTVSVNAALITASLERQIFFHVLISKY